MVWYVSGVLATLRMVYEIPMGMMAQTITHLRDTYLPMVFLPKIADQKREQHNYLSDIVSILHC